MDLDEVVALQRRLGLADIHVVYLDVDRFYLAHTDMERNMKRIGMFDLADCPVHKWLNGLGMPPAIGLFIVRPRDHDGYSDSFRSDAWPWELQPLGAN